MNINIYLFMCLFVYLFIYDIAAKDLNRLLRLNQIALSKNTSDPINERDKISLLEHQLYTNILSPLRGCPSDVNGD